MAGRRVLITGRTGGIGRATAEGLSAMGAHVTITGRDAVRAEDAARLWQVSADLVELAPHRAG